MPKSMAECQAVDSVRLVRRDDDEAMFSMSPEQRKTRERREGEKGRVAGQGS